MLHAKHHGKHGGTFDSQGARGSRSVLLFAMPWWDVYNSTHVRPPPAMAPEAAVPLASQPVCCLDFSKFWMK